jgi:hypothetical protein
MTRLAIACALVLGCVPALRADFGIMSFTATESGTFQGQSFTNAAVTFRSTYDTGAVTVFMDPVPNGLIGWYAPTLSGSVTVAGIGSASVPVSIRVETYSLRDAWHGQGGTPPGFFGLGLQTGQLFQYLGCDGPYEDRNLTHSIAPTPQIYVATPPEPYVVHTSCGDLTLTSQVALIGWTAQVDVVPEPSSFTLLSVCGAGLLGYAWRRRQLVASLA